MLFGNIFLAWKEGGGRPDLPLPNLERAIEGQREDIDRILGSTLCT
jgi:hypothetical protein